MTTPITRETADMMFLALSKLRDTSSDLDGWVGSSAYTLGTLESMLADVLTDDQGRELTKRILRRMETLINNRKKDMQPTHY